MSSISLAFLCPDSNPLFFPPFIFFTFWFHLHARILLRGVLQPLIGPTTYPEGGAIAPKPGIIL